jgi:PhzF family phenazine biosynthesis protein
VAQRVFTQVDVFTEQPYLGNPLAVVLDGEGLSTEEMQQFTDWTNLSECTFLVPVSNPDADYHVRIFCPGRELPFAGHPTLGTCHAWLAAGGRPKGDDIVQQCGAGLITIRRDPASGRLAFAAPPLRRSGPMDEPDVALVARGLGIDRSMIVAHAWCDNGPGWRAVLLDSAERVLAARPDATILHGLDVGVAGRRNHGETDLEVRAFFPGTNGLAEDPVTGSLNAGLGQWLIGAGLMPTYYVAAQGTAIGRAGRVHVQQLGDQIWVGGSVVTCISGTVEL